METELGRQTLALLLALALGALAGIIYDLLRPLRRRAGHGPGAALDALFCLITGAALFTYAMGAGNGRLGLWELAAALLGFLAYMHTLSDPILKFFTAILDGLCKAAVFCKKIIKKQRFRQKVSSKK